MNKKESLPQEKTKAPSNSPEGGELEAEDKMSERKNMQRLQSPPSGD
jgi:hypothetical protein